MPYCWTWRIGLSAKKAAKAGDRKELAFPPATAADKPWRDKFYTVPIKVRDRELFA